MNENRVEQARTFSVCIATHERSRLLAGALEALSRQTRLPEEIVVSDSSGSADSRELVWAFSSRHPAVSVKHVPSFRSALPWQRWWAFRHAAGSVILFLDDDVTLAPRALEVLEQAYKDLAADPGHRIAGIGFWIAFEDGSRPARNPSSLKERWLGISRLPSGSLTSGGLTVSLAGFVGREPVEVDILWGGAMSFDRQALAGIPLENLVSLYEAGFGRGEDAVLSSHARRLGKLFILNEPFAVHPPLEKLKIATPYAKRGWTLGMTQTFGRAHTMRWLASDRLRYERDWWRFVTFDLFRCAGALARRPWRGSGWQYLAGACFGIALTLFRWRRIPPSEKSGTEFLELNRASI